MKRLVVARNSDGTEFLVLHANGEHVQKHSGKYQFICYQIKMCPCMDVMGLLLRLGLLGLPRTN